MIIFVNSLLQLTGIFYKLRSKLQYSVAKEHLLCFCVSFLMYGTEIAYMLIRRLLTWINWSRLITDYLEYCKNQPYGTPDRFNLLSIDR